MIIIGLVLMFPVLFVVGYYIVKTMSPIAPPPQITGKKLCEQRGYHIWNTPRVSVGGYTYKYNCTCCGQTKVEYTPPG